MEPMDITNGDAMAVMCRGIFDRWGSLDLWLHTAIHAAPMARASARPASVSCRWADTLSRWNGSVSAWSVARGRDAPPKDAFQPLLHPDRDRP